MLPTTNDILKNCQVIIDNYIIKVVRVPIVVVPSATMLAPL